MVRQGDTLSTIAASHGTTWQRIYAANKAVIGEDPNLIVPGQRLDL
ncbi:LysM domain-containing protein [Streptomyces sp900105245]